MKVTALTTQLVNLPLDKPIRTAIHDMRSVGCVCLTIHTDQGIVGEAYAFSLNALRLNVFDEMIKGLEHLVVGKDPHYSEGIWQSIWQEINPSGLKGVTVSALSTIDTALWDIVGKAAQQPLYKLFGACRDSVATYASGGLWLSASVDELVAEADELVEQGFVAMKLRLGKATIAEDIERVKQVRQTIGPDIGLLCDANQAFTPKQAIRLGEELQTHGVNWFEEPVASYDLKGHAQVRDALSLDVASGEGEYTRFGIQAMIDAGAVDILMPDLQRIGGLTEMLRVAHLAGAHNLPISTHIFTEQSLSIAGSCNNCISVEHMPWHARLFNESMVLEAGRLNMPKGHGLGFTFNADVLAHYSIK
jgi:L-alanine-DL-glutamate epimerase-like enolase superfamily enzyme